MGSERKSKDRKKRSSLHSASDSEGEGRRSKKHRTSQDDAKRSSSKRRKEDKSHKHSKRRSSKEKKLEREPKSWHSKHDRHSDVEFCKLSKDDYYSKNNEFATWLKEERDQFFSDLTSQSARELFSEFVADWNDHKLETKYYEGIMAGPRTAHKWKIKKQHLCNARIRSYTPTPATPCKWESCH